MRLLESRLNMWHRAAVTEPCLSGLSIYIAAFPSTKLENSWEAEDGLDHTSHTSVVAFTVNLAGHGDAFQ